MGETRSAIRKKSNRGIITRTEFNQAIQRLEVEFIYRADVEKVNATEDQKRDAWQFIDTYSVNSSDADILQCALDKVDELRTAGDNLILVSSDKRLLAAATKEGLFTFNPETDNQSYLDFLINS